MNEPKFLVFIKKNKIIKKGVHKGEAPVYIRLTLNGRREEVVVKNLSCMVDEWDVAKSEISGRGTEVMRRNSLINKKKSEILSVIKEFERASSDLVLDTKIVLNKINGKEVRIKITICELFEEHNRDFLDRVVSIKDRSMGTYERYQTVLKILKLYMQKVYHSVYRKKFKLFNDLFEITTT